MSRLLHEYGVRLLVLVCHGLGDGGRFIGPVPGKAMLLCVPGRPGGTPEPRLTGLVRVVR
jgi:hypothetical protein